MYSGAVLRKLQKKNRIEVTEFKSKFFERFQSNLPKTMYFRYSDFILTFFFHFSQKCADYIDPSGNFCLLCNFV